MERGHKIVYMGQLTQLGIRIQRISFNKNKGNNLFIEETVIELVERKKNVE